MKIGTQMIVSGMLFLSHFPTWTDGVAAGMSRSLASCERPRGAQCWEEEQSFSTAFRRPIAYCRGHLHFAPGAADCYTLADLVCMPGSQRWDLPGLAYPTRQAYYFGPFSCPAEPKPPRCTRSYPIFQP